MLRSLRIRGFRAFRNLEVSSLARVNLLVGRNNVGKTTVLEALGIFASGLDAPLHIRQLLKDRNEYLRQAIQENISWDVDRIFNDGEAERREFEVGELDGNNRLTFRFGWIIDTVFDEQSSRRSFSSTLPDDAASTSSNEIRPGFFIGIRGDTRLIPTELIERARPNYVMATSREPYLPSFYLPLGGLSDSAAAKLWDSVVLTEHEELVLEALRIIEPELERIVVIEPINSRSDRVALVKLRKKNLPVPLRSLGDGMRRIFQLVLSLVSAKNGMLLVDEVDNGIHYSVQDELWRVIFLTAEKLNVQVFSTTHSWDCIRAFQHAASASREEGCLVRLSKYQEEIFATVFSEKDLEIVTRESVEVR